MDLAVHSADPTNGRGNQLSLPAVASAVLGVVGGGRGAAVPWCGAHSRLPRAAHRGGPGPGLVEALAIVVGRHQRIAMLTGASAADRALEAAVIAWTRRSGRALLLVAPEPDYAWSGPHPLDQAAPGHPEVEVALCDEPLLQAGAKRFWCPDRAVRAPEDRWLPAAMLTATTWGADLMLVGAAPASGRRWSPGEAAQRALARSILDPAHTRGAFDSDTVYAEAARADERRYPPGFPLLVGPEATATARHRARVRVMAHTVEREWRDRFAAAAPAVRAPWLHVGPGELRRVPSGLAGPRRFTPGDRMILPKDLPQCRLVGLLRQEFPPLVASSRLGVALESVEQWLRFDRADATVTVP